MRLAYVGPVKHVARDVLGRVVRCGVVGCGFQIGQIEWLPLEIGRYRLTPPFVEVEETIEGWALFLNEDLIYDWARGVWHVGSRYRRYETTDRRGAPEPMRRWVHEVAMRRLGPMRPDEFLRSLIPYWRELSQKRTNRPPVRLPATVICPGGHQSLLDPDALGLTFWFGPDGTLRRRSS